MKDTISIRNALDRFTHSQHRPSLIHTQQLILPAILAPMSRQNFRKAN